MRKNLFLTLALVLASFAGAIAQNWSVTLGGTEGLPGESVSIDGGDLTYFKSGIIKADKPIKTLRVTCAGNTTGNKPNGNNYRLMLSELNVYTADMSKELTYTVTTNADHNSLTKSFDGQGLKALYDGKYNNWFASMTGETGAVAEYHYLELTFEEEIERFIIEWGSKQGSGEVPSLIGLTEGGVDFEPYTDRSSSFGDEKITTLEDLVAAEYFVIRGNAPTSYNTYDNQTGDLTSKDGALEGVGPMYVTCGNITAEEPTIDYLARLIPVEGKEGKYYVYFTQQQKYLNGNATDNSLNDAFNGWQVATVYQDKAAEVSFNELENGDFEMYYTTTKNGEEYTVYIGADPRTREQQDNALGEMKIFTENKKIQLVANGWCEGFGLICTFNWSFYPADYYAPAWAKEYELGNLYIAAKSLKDAIEGYTLPTTEDYEEIDADIYNEGQQGVIEELNEVITALEEAMETSDEMDETEIQETIAEQEEAIGTAIYNMSEVEYDAYGDLWSFWADNSSVEVATGKWSFEAYENYIKPGKELIEEASEADEEEYFGFLDGMTEYFTNKAENEAEFLSSKFQDGSFKLEFTSEAQLGELVDDTYYVWEQAISVPNAVNGIRITFKATNGGSGTNEKFGYPVVALGELEIYNGADKVALSAANCSTNSQETAEGPITNLVDGNPASFWHSIWGNGVMDPVGYVYLDVAFPEGVSLQEFTVKLYSRDTKALAPKAVEISAYVPVEKENIYNVTKGAQITDIANLKNGGLYLIQGNLNVNKSEEAAEPRFYAGATPAGSGDGAINEKCVYMFKKVGDGWNILSLNDAKYWTEAPEYGAKNLNEFAAKAGSVKFAPSNNMTNTFVIYSEIADSIVKGSFTQDFEDESKTDINIEETDVTVNRVVYMDWDNGLASRLCYSELPGVLDPQFTTALEGNEDLLVASSAGDYLHFNKTNGEGEWSIYEVKLENADYLYLKGLTNIASDPSFVPGNNPGCIKADAELITEFNNAKATADVVVKEEKTAEAKAAAEALATVIEKFATAERVGFDPEIAYNIQSSFTGFLEKTWATRSIYYESGESKLMWTVTPENIADRPEFLFQIVEIDEEYAITNNLNVTSDQYGKVFTIKSLGKNQFVIDNWGTGARPAIHTIENLEASEYKIITSGQWHAENHWSGTNYGSTLCNYGGGANSCSSWTFIAVTDIDNVQLSVEDVVVEGDEVVSVNYFTPAGVAIAEPVKGINIVVTVYANGVVEAKKVLVK